MHYTYTVHTLKLKLTFIADTLPFNLLSAVQLLPSVLEIKAKIVVGVQLFMNLHVYSFSGALCD